MATFFQSFELRHSQFPLVTRKTSLPRYPNGNDPQNRSAHFSNLQTNLNEKTKCLLKKYFFDFTQKLFPIATDNKTEEEITIFRNTTLGFSEIAPEVVINNISKLSKSSTVPVKNNKYDLNILKNSVDKDSPERFQDQIESFMKVFSDIFSKRHWDLHKCDVTTQWIEVEPGSKPLKIPRFAMPLHYKADLRKKTEVFFGKKAINTM